MSAIVRLCGALLVIAVVFAGFTELVRAFRPVPKGAVLPLVVYGAIAIFGYRRSVAKPELSKPRRFVARRRALPPAPKEDA